MLYYAVGNISGRDCVRNKNLAGAGEVRLELKGRPHPAADPLGWRKVTEGHTRKSGLRFRIISDGDSNDNETNRQIAICWLESSFPSASEGTARDLCHGAHTDDRLFPGSVRRFAGDQGSRDCRED